MAIFQAGRYPRSRRLASCTTATHVDYGPYAPATVKEKSQRPHPQKNSERVLVKYGRRYQWEFMDFTKACPDRTRRRDIL